MEDVLKCSKTILTRTDLNMFKDYPKWNSSYYVINMFKEQSLLEPFRKCSKTTFTGIALKMFKKDKPYWNSPKHVLGIDINVFKDNP